MKNLMNKILHWLLGTKPEPPKKQDNGSVEYQIQSFREQLEKDYQQNHKLKKKLEKHKIQ